MDAPTLTAIRQTRWAAVPASRRRRRPRIDPRLAPVYRLADRCGYDARHAHQVARIAVEIFDQTRALHRLDDADRHWLTCGALLHDIGKLHGSAGHHKASLRIIRASSVLEWTTEQRLIVGAVARYHRRALPRRKHGHFMALPRKTRPRVALLAGIVRLADALDDTHRGAVAGLTCTHDARTLRIDCDTRRPALREELAAERKADLLTIALDRTVRVGFHRVD